jgi:hypothetical protein
VKELIDVPINNSELAEMYESLRKRGTSAALLDSLSLMVIADRLTTLTKLFVEHSARRGVVV